MANPLPSIDFLNIHDRQRLERELSIPKRPNTGSLGKGIRLLANYFCVTQLPVGEIVQYDVNISPEVPRALRRRLFAELEEKYRKSELGGHLLAYDGMANLFVLGVLPKDVYSLKVSIPGRRQDEMRDFQFKLRRVSSVNMATLKTFLEGKLDHTPYDVITALEVIMRHPMAAK